MSILGCGGGDTGNNSPTEKPVQGCIADYECKDERICIEGKCIDNTKPNGNPDTVSSPDTSIILPDTIKPSPDTIFINLDTSIYQDSKGGDNQSFPDASCLPKSYFGCHQGDLWWFDSCGQPQKLKESCDYGCEEGLDEGICKEAQVDTYDSNSFDMISNNDIFIPEVTGCSSEEYTCLDGKCIDLNWVCDGMNDCSKGEDEKGCAPVCEDECFKNDCKNNFTYTICDDYNGDGCLEVVAIIGCGPGMYCDDGECKSGGQSCENECNYVNETYCVGNDIVTCGNYDNDSCIEWSEVSACGSEMYCKDGKCKPKNPCNPDVEWKCPYDDGKCIPQSSVCDGTTDCSFEADEENCSCGYIADCFWDQCLDSGDTVCMENCDLKGTEQGKELLDQAVMCVLEHCNFPPEKSCWQETIYGWCKAEFDNCYGDSSGPNNYDFFN